MSIRGLCVRSLLLLVACSAPDGGPDLPETTAAPSTGPTDVPPTGPSLEDEREDDGEGEQQLEVYADRPVTGFHASIASLCRDYVARARATMSERRERSLKDVEVRRPSCALLTDSLPFIADSKFRSLSAVRVDDGIAKESLLVVELARGFALTAIGWDADDPDDPGCGVIAREAHVERAYVESERLVVVLAATRSAYVETQDPDDDGYRPGLVRVAVWCGDDGTALACVRPSGYGVFLGRKIYSEWVPSRPIDWTLVPWIEERTLRIHEDGTGWL
jgi:hypothetical protein